MITYAHTQCEHKGCTNYIAVHIAKDMKKKGKPVLCYEHFACQPERIKKLYKTEEVK